MKLLLLIIDSRIAHEHSIYTTRGYCETKCTIDLLLGLICKYFPIYYELSII